VEVAKESLGDCPLWVKSGHSMRRARRPPGTACSTPKIKIGLVVCGYSNPVRAPPYNAIATKQS